VQLTRGAAAGALVVVAAVEREVEVLEAVEVALAAAVAPRAVAEVLLVVVALGAGLAVAVLEAAAVLRLAAGAQGVPVELAEVEESVVEAAVRRELGYLGLPTTACIGTTAESSTLQIAAKDGCRIIPNSSNRGTMCSLQPTISL
jgi:hypothetical protein